MTRKDELQRLEVASPCQSSWEAMHGDGRRRHCLECDKHVYDFARLTPREIAGVIEASRGHLCARQTRDAAGRLVTLMPAGAAPRPAPGRVSPLVATVVTALLGMSGAAWADSAAAVSPAAEQGPGERPGGARPQRTGDAGSSLEGRLTNEAGEPIADAEVTVFNSLDQQERAGTTDADGRFSFASLPPGIYGLSASVRGHDAAHQSDVVLFAGETRQIELTVPSDVWQRIVGGDEILMVTLGVTVAQKEPLRKVYGDADMVVLAVAGKSVTVREGEYTREVRTDLVISSPR